MFCVFLKFSAGKAQAPQHMAGHQRWIEDGFRDGVFLVTGSLGGNQGGVVIAHATTLEALEKRVALDPFVTADVVTAEIVVMTPHRADPRLHFLLQQA